MLSLQTKLQFDGHTGKNEGIELKLRTQIDGQQGRQPCTMDEIARHGAVGSNPVLSKSKSF